MCADGSYWEMLGKKDLQKALNSKRYEGVARNVIFFVGDGMGVPTHTMARIYKVYSFWVILVYFLVCRGRRRENLERRKVLYGKIFPALA